MAFTGRAAVGSPSATASWAASTSSTARWPRASASWAAISPRRADICDAIRSYAPGFIFTTSLAPAIAAGAVASIRHLKASGAERERHQERARALKRRLAAAGLPVMDNPSHIVPILVGDPVLTKRITDALLERFAIYVQPINYPTVPRGTERLRLTPTPVHSDLDIDRLVAALSTLWTELGLPLEGQAQAAE